MSKRIFVVSGYGYWGNFSPDDLFGEDTQIGGGETAMICIARELAALGHEVVVFYNVEKPGKYGGVDYMPVEMFEAMAHNMEHDALVSWDFPHAFRYNTKSGKRIMAYQLNNAFVGLFDYVIDAYMHPSWWHAERFKELYPEIDDEKQFAPITNGVYTSRYEAQERDPYRVIYSSSPDRGLHHLLSIWPEIVAREPRANLKVFYDAKKWIDTVKSIGRELNTTERALLIDGYMKLNMPNVEFVGAVGQGRIAREQAMATVLAYPCDPVDPTEGFSMTVLEGLTAGCQAVISDADAFPELWGDHPNSTMLPLPFDKQTWIDAIVSKFGKATEFQNVGHDWKELAKRWEKIINAT